MLLPLPNCYLKVIIPVCQDATSNVFSEQTMAATNKEMVCMKSLQSPDSDSISHDFVHDILFSKWRFWGKS